MVSKSYSLVVLFFKFLLWISISSTVLLYKIGNFIYHPSYRDIMFGMKRKIIGLFGTCGKTTWRRDIAIPLIEKAGKKYFNPQRDDWSEEHVRVEYDHLMNDKVIVQVITYETGGFGSLAETGWIATGALLRGQKVGFYIEEGLKTLLNPEERRARELIKYHINNLKGHVYLANSIQDLIKWAVNQL